MIKKTLLGLGLLCVSAIASWGQQYPSPIFNNLTVQGTGTAVNFSFTGSATAVTQTQGDNSTKLATTSYVDTGLATKATLVGGVVPIASGGTGASTAPGARTNLGLGSAAVQNIGTNGANVPLMSTANTWLTGQIVGSGVGDALVQLNGAAGANRWVQFESNGSQRWSIAANTTAESGGNAGSDWAIARYSDAGALIDSPFIITRSTGLVSLGDGLTVTGTTTLNTPLGIASGGNGANTAAGARSNLGLGTIATQNSNAVAITGGTISGATVSGLASPLAIADGGTAGATALAARTNLAVPWELISTTSASGAASWTATNLSAYRKLRITGTLVPSVNSALGVRTSTNNGTSYDSGASDYITQILGIQGAASSASQSTASSLSLTGTSDGSTVSAISITITNFNQATTCQMMTQLTGILTGTPYNELNAGIRNNTTARNAIQIFPTSGTLTYEITLEGIRG